MNRRERRQLAREQQRNWGSSSLAARANGVDGLAAAVQHHEAGRLPEAEAIYRRILQTHPRQADALHLLGLAAYQTGKHDEAVGLIREAIAINSRAAAYHNNLGLALRAQGKHGEATASFRRAIALTHNYAEAHHNLGVVLGEQERPDEAVASFRRALAFNRDYADAYTNLGLTLAGQGRPEEAAENLRRAAILNPDSAEVHSNLGLTLARLGKLEQAVESLRAAAELKPESAEVHNNLGITLRNHGKVDEAVESIQRALALEPDYAEAHHNLGVALGDRGEHEAGAECLKRALALKSDYPDAHSNLGVALRNQGKLDEAADSLRRAVALKPEHAEAHNNLGCVLRDRGEPDEAIEAFRAAVAQKPDYPEALSNLGLTLEEQGQHDEAADCLRRAIALRPDYPEALGNLGLVLKNQGKLDEAVGSLERALGLRPDYPEALSSLGVVLGEQGKHDQAVERLRQALAVKPDFAEAHSNLGVVLRNQDRFEEALASFQQALVVRPEYPEGHHNLAVMQSDLGQVDEAIASERRAVALKQDYGEAQFGLALAMLLRGDLEQGFAGYEWRWRCADLASGQRKFLQPQWDGSPLDGRTILLHPEQGLGDTLQFVRYTSLVAARGGRVIVECQGELTPLLRDLAGVDQVVSRGETLPPFDVHAPLLSLPHLFGTTLGTIPADIPYVRVDPGRAAAWADYLDSETEPGLRVGLVWAGNPDHKSDRRRSLPLSALAPLSQVRGVRLFALQKGAAAAQAEAPPDGLALTNLGPLLGDFSDTAAVLQQLDLVITVDTSVAHLAGALGLPVWVLLAFAPDWRWLRQREDSPWYPGARLFRQEHVGDWAGVVSRVTSSLEELAASERRGSIPRARRRRKPPQPAKDGQAQASAMYVAVPLSRMHDWGIQGKQLAKELAILGDTRLVTDPFDLDAVGDEMEYEFLKRLVHTGLTAPADASVLQCIRGGDLLPYRPTLRGRLTAGYAIFEENILPLGAVENARRHFDVVVAGSRWLQQVLQAHGLSNVRTIIQGIDPAVYFPTGLEKEQFRDRFVVFSGGKFELRKGQDLVIRAYKALQDRHKDVMLVNSWFNPWELSLNTMRVSRHIRFEPTATDHVERINQLVSDNGIDVESVITLQPRPNVTMSNFYRNSDVGLFPSRCEGGTNLVLMEYMACGKPAIVSYNSGHKDIVHADNAVLLRSMTQVTIEQNGRHAATWDEPSLEEIVEHLDWAYHHREQLAEIGKRAGEDLAQLTWKSRAQQFYSLLAGATEGLSSPEALPGAVLRPTPSDSVVTRVDDPPAAAVQPNGSIDLRKAAVTEGKASKLGAEDARLVARLELTREYQAIRDQLADPCPADGWLQDGLHFFAFELVPFDGAALHPTEPPTAVFAVHPEFKDVVSAVVVTQGKNGAEPEVVDLRQADVARAPAERPSNTVSDGAESG